MTDETELRPKNGLRPIHPGEILLCEFLLPALNLDIGLEVDDGTFEDIILRQEPMPDDIAELLAMHFQTTPDVWRNLQDAWNEKQSRDPDPVAEERPLADAFKDSPLLLSLGACKLLDQLKEQNDELAAALRVMLHQTMCSLEGLSSGQPTLQEIEDAAEKAHAALEKYERTRK